MLTAVAATSASNECDPSEIIELQLATVKQSAGRDLAPFTSFNFYLPAFFLVASSLPSHFRTSRVSKFSNTLSSPDDKLVSKHQMWEREKNALETK